MEHAEETDLGTEMPWIAGDFKQSLCAGVEEQVVDEPLVLQCERSQFPRQGEDGMYVASGQKLAFARLGASVGARCPGIACSACFCRSCMRSWSYVRSRCSGRDVRPGRSATACNG